MFLPCVKKVMCFFFVTFFFCFALILNKQQCNVIFKESCFLTKIDTQYTGSTKFFTGYTLDKNCSFEVILKNWNCVNIVVARTDNLHVVFDLVGGDLVNLNLLKYRSVDNSGSFSMLDCSNTRYYYVQSSVLKPTEALSTRVVYSVAKTFFTLVDDDLRLNVDFVSTCFDGISVVKRYILTKNSHIVTVSFVIKNNSDVDFFAKNFYRIVRKTEESNGLFKAVAGSFVGAAVTTDDKLYKKIFFKDLESSLYQQVKSDGWAAMVERYFISAWLPTSSVMYYYVAEALGNGIYSVGFSDCTPYKITSGDCLSIDTKLYVGPTEVDSLQKLGHGLELSVDYGIFWPVSKVLFKFLCFIHTYVNNWGFSIVILTVFVKLMFYPLSTVSYRSMRNMRKLQPQIEAIKVKYVGNKQLFSTAVMELYKKESVNPLSGCLPMLVQIPVFISLYYVILEAVELRKAPFVFWLQDLSAYDPFYVLPVIMGISMYVQQKLTPTPTDELQGKIMLFLPFFFTFLFLNFPSGLVLYWIINNSFSIIQQWFILNRT